MGRFRILFTLIDADFPAAASGHSLGGLLPELPEVGSCSRLPSNERRLDQNLVIDS